MKQATTAPPPHMPVLMALIWPICVAGIFATVINSFVRNIPSLDSITGSNSIVLAGLGITALLQGLRWYGRDGMAIRGGRPMLAGIGFAFLGWIGLLIARFVAVGIDNEAFGANLGITFLFLLIFEAFCVQLWTFGLFFRTIADWRNPISAALLSGVLYGLTAFLLFGESFNSRLAILFFVVMGVFYGIIRLRTGSFLGMVFIQAMQTLTVWHLLPADDTISLPYLYGISCAVFILVTWRLLPKYTSDYRV